MKFNYLVKHNGVYYKPGEDVPVDNVKTADSTGANNPVVKAEKTVVITEDKPNVDAKSKLTKTEINRMSTADLKKLAVANGISGDYAGNALKKMLIDKLV